MELAEIGAALRTTPIPVLDFILRLFAATPPSLSLIAAGCGCQVKRRADALEILCLRRAA